MIEILGMISSTAVLLYGVLLSVKFAGGCRSRNEKLVIAFLCFGIWLMQILIWQYRGTDFTKQIYPLFSHFSIILTLVFVLKKPFGITVASVLTAYFCCQIPRWIGTIFLHVFEAEIAYYISYIISIVPIFFLLKKYFTTAAYRAMTYSKQSLLLFGGLPLFYYVFDYATTVYTDLLYQGVRMICEFLPAAMALFYVVFVTAYHNEVQSRNKAQLQNSLLAMKIKQAKNDIFAQKIMQEKTAAYRHDMRHHLAIIGGYLNVGQPEKAIEYIKSAQNDIELFTPKCYCENDTMNLIFSSFYEKAKNLGVELSIDANIPQKLSISETSLCALLSNGLENAVFAAAQLSDDNPKTVRVNCQTHKNNLLVYIQNPYKGEKTLQNRLPTSNRAGHGFGVKSIKMIADAHNGYCSFDGKDGLFTLKVVLPLKSV